VPRQRTRWDKDNEVSVNPWAFVTVGLFVLGIAGLALLLALA
jgi:hypothetical protein